MKMSFSQYIFRYKLPQIIIYIFYPENSSELSCFFLESLALMKIQTTCFQKVNTNVVLAGIKPQCFLIFTLFFCPFLCWVYFYYHSDSMQVEALLTLLKKLGGGRVLVQIFLLLTSILINIFCVDENIFLAACWWSLWNKERWFSFKPAKVSCVD